MQIKVKVKILVLRYHIGKKMCIVEKDILCWWDYKMVASLKVIWQQLLQLKCIYLLTYLFHY